MKSRTVRSIEAARPSSDGAGVKIMRLGGRQIMETMDPFLMLDEIHSDNADDYIGGFPEHPHRGFETITYMRQGTFEHKDSIGNQGFLTSGGVQWMKAGRGVIHSEMPQTEEGEMHGFQLWLNLPAANKMDTAEYRDIVREEIPIVSTMNMTAKVIAGEFSIDDQQIKGPLQRPQTQPHIMDIELKVGDAITILSDPELSGVIYVYDGQINVGHAGVQTPINEKQLGVLGDGQQLQLTTSHAAKALLLMGKPLKEPIAHYGPFVMNQVHEIDQAIWDFRNGALI